MRAQSVRYHRSAVNCNDSLGRAAPRWPPLHTRAATGEGTITEIVIDQGLVGDLEFLGEALEIVHGGLVEPHRHGLLEALRVRIPLRLGEIVFLSHHFHRASYWARSDRVARRAEMRRIRSPSSSSQWITHKHTKGGTEADQDEAFLVDGGVLGIRHDERVFVREGSLSLIEADTMLVDVRAGFRRVPFKP